ncbi:thioredoxin family protein [Roseiconus lacunae]|uniref:Thioredoxin family protein n=1 Tax=Roseiconus lacunae TaxID=2605694 RepID=A0ABT7PSL7_9BACT|nr:thioredoxin family protein [Roseiconus lacunae]MDM4019488.1 thioredoxin family protein [Roseiconus lacunae]
MPNQAEQWSAFLDRNAQSVSRLGRLAPQLATFERFDDLLKRGASQVGDSLTLLDSLDDAEWATLASLLSAYSTEWETYFDPLIYTGYYKELDRRFWTPSTPPLTSGETAAANLVIHFWAPWNAHDRTFDQDFQLVVQRMQSRVLFRSMNVDLPSCADVFTKNDVLNVPSLAFYNNGIRSHTTVGVRPASEIESEVKTWLSASNAR